MSGGEALVRSLVREGVEVVFGLPGVQMYGILAALRDEPGIRLITTRNEQATTFMADGYARAGGRAGVALVVPGPGLLNASSGLSTAFSASSPVLAIAGQIPRETIGKDLGGLHEINDQIDAIKPVTKWRKRLLHPGEIPTGVQEAFKQLRNGRPRPVEIEMPPEAMVEREELDLLEPEPVERSAPDAETVGRAAEMLRAAHRPLIYAGGGVHLSDAHDELRALVDSTGIPVVTSGEGKGVISDRHPLSLGASTWRVGRRREHIERCDVMLAVGTRLALGAPKPEARVIHIDVDADEIGRNHRNTFPLVGDAKVTLAALRSELSRDGNPSWSDLAAEVEALRERLEGPEERNEPQDSLLRSLRAHLPDEAITVWGMTQLGYYSRPFWPTYLPRTYFDSGYSGNLGYAFPTALGAKVARPDVPVVCITGDGGFGYNLQEMSTAVRYGINVVTVLFNDNAYGNVSRDMEAEFGGVYGSDLHNPDFMKLAEAFGMVGLRTDEADGVGPLVGKAIDMDRPVLVEVPVGSMPRPTMLRNRPPWALPQE